MTQYNNRFVNIDFHQFSKSKILVIGDIMLDCYLWGDVHRISPEAPVPIVRSRERTYMLGGAGNVALNIANLGCSIDMIAFCGPDSAGNRIRRMLMENSISATLFEDKDRLTTTKTRIMALKQQLLRIDEEEQHIISNREIECVLDDLEKRISKYQVVVLSDYGKGSLQAKGFTERIIALCRRCQVPVLVDPKGDDWVRYQHATCITPNHAELNIISKQLPSVSSIFNSKDDQTLILVAEQIRSKYALDWLLVTRGAEGMCLTGKNAPPFMVSTEARQVYDVSGAGDTVIAVLSAGISTGLTFKEAAELANTAAGIVVGKVGTQPVSLIELQEAWEAKKSHMQVHEQI